MIVFTEIQKEAFKAAGEGDFERVKEMLAGPDLIKDKDKLAAQLRETQSWSDMDPHDHKSVEFLYMNAARGAPMGTLLPVNTSREGHVAILEYMFEHYPYPKSHLLDAIGDAILHGSIETVRFFLERWPEIVHVNQCGSHGGTPLSLALLVERRAAAHSMTELLLQYGADPNKESQGLPMEYAITSSWPDLVPLLEKYGAEPFSWEKELQLLPRAASNGKFEAVTRLIEKGAHPDTDTLEPPFSGTPLWNAVRRGDYKMVEYLICAGADPNRRTSAGESMLQVAESLSVNKDETMVSLRAFGAK
ncbi:Ankyrin repeat protein [Lasiodiplodia theobromae]|uniref:Putative ankyrin repeat protein n=1 Tax=Lasiodiplodia theobromae TaxID=45133 RepID=A0A5N5D276_9PEZI|nr:Ankyrin repeat protein [Lasiodiplodia theobromae]KAB2571502.1 putative ankyrin repeat protein [Lasiodiplodia theobromae]KAF4538167.1 Ankyrin repeat protein [Lasiodiplodia theobromae]